MKRVRKSRQNVRKTVARPRLAASQSYHHGDLHDALLKAAETVLERDGVNGLTLRAAAREAGVSHAAPTHHFGDMTGLVSELAAVGFRRFTAALAAAASAATLQSAHARLEAMGVAYVTFARTYPGLFMLMFRSERLDMERPGLQEAVHASSAALANAVAARRGETPPAARPSAAQAAEMLRAWSMVHGFAVLLLDGRLDDFIAMWPGADPDKLLSAMLRQPQAAAG